MSLRVIMRGFGLKVGATTPKTFAKRVEELVEHLETLIMLSTSLLAVRAALEGEFKILEKRSYTLSRQDERTKLLVTTPASARL